MKNIFLIITVLITISCKSQVYPLRTFTDVPTNAYLKDTNNELSAYEATWKGTWNNKTISITFKKITNFYNSSLNQYRDILVARFKATDLNGNTLFDNTNLPDDDVKIEGQKFRKKDDKYSLIYIDMDLCERSGMILINFADIKKTKLQWIYSQDENFIEPDCFYYNYAPQNYPQPLPNNIVLTKQQKIK